MTALDDFGIDFLVMSKAFANAFLLSVSFTKGEIC